MESYYLQLVRSDLLTLLKELPEVGSFTLREDGKVSVTLRPDWDTPWHHVIPMRETDCHLWHKLIFRMLGFVPSRCQECYKVVVRPRTLRGLFALLRVQQELALPSKCGIELREYVPALYGGYFYNRGLKRGKECYRVVRANVDRNEQLGPDVSVILKRGCTEMEHQCGPSNGWSVADGQHEAEAFFDNSIVRVRTYDAQPELIIKRVHRRWIEFAFAAGDETYRDYTGGEPLYPPSVTYHNEMEPVEGAIDSVLHSLPGP